MRLYHDKTPHAQTSLSTPSWPPFILGSLFILQSRNHTHYPHLWSSCLPGPGHHDVVSLSLVPQRNGIKQWLLFSCEALELCVLVASSCPLCRPDDRDGAVPSVWFFVLRPVWIWSFISVRVFFCSNICSSSSLYNLFLAKTFYFYPLASTTFVIVD